MSDFNNRSVVDEVRVARITETDSERPLLTIIGAHGTSKALNDTAISGTDRSGATADPDWQTISTDADGSDTDSTLLVELKHGVSDDPGGSPTDLASASYGDNAWQFSEGGSGANETAVATLGELVDAINDLEKADNDGRVFDARIGDELRSLSLAAATFTDVSETRLGARDYKTGVLGNTASAFRAAKRIGVPEPRHNGRVKLIGIAGSATGVTNGTVKLYRDDGEEEVLLLEKTLVAAQTDYVDYTASTDSAPVYRGSLVLVVESDDLSAVDFNVRYINAEY